LIRDQIFSTGRFSLFAAGAGAELIMKIILDGRQYPSWTRERLMNTPADGQKQPPTSGVGDE
jgi:hypothetical protein